MKDTSFVAERVKRGEEARRKVEREFSQISLEQLNWKLSAESWSIGECLEHLLVADALYFDSLEKIGKGTYTMTFFEKYSPLSGLFGSLLKDQLQEQVNKKMVAPRKFIPATANKPADFVQTYLKHLDTFLDYISKCENVDIDRVKITSPSVGFVTYSLRDAFQFLIEHEHRHINQAMRVKLNPDFPS